MALAFSLAERVLPEPAALCPIRFQGQWHDEETGLSYNRFRYYDPLGAHYLSSDPIAIIGGARSYNFVLNPTRWIDPLGLACCDEQPRDEKGRFSGPGSKLGGGWEEDVTNDLQSQPAIKSTLRYTLAIQPIPANILSSTT